MGTGIGAPRISAGAIATLSPGVVGGPGGVVVPGGSEEAVAVRWRQHDHQRAVVECDAKYVVLVAGRRGGKSEAEVQKLLTWIGMDLLMGIEGVYWIILPTYALARPLYRKLKRMMPPGWVTHEVGTETSPGTIYCGPVRIEFRSAENPQTLVAEGLRGALIDEAGIMKEIAWTESIMPTLIDHDAPAILGGTPKGRNWFYRMYLRGQDPLDSRVRSFHWPSWANPFVPLTAIRELAKDMSERMFRQEILAEFLEDDGAVFRGVRSCVGPLSKEKTHVVGVDLARVQDFTVLHGLDRHGATTSWERFNQVSWPIQKARIIERSRQTGALFVVDATNGSVGDPIVADLRAAGVKILPFKFTNASKHQLVERLSIAIEQKKIVLPDEPVLLNELEVFEFETTKAGNLRYNAPEGAHDDAVMALGLALWGTGRRAPDMAPLHY